MLGNIPPLQRGCQYALKSICPNEKNRRGHAAGSGFPVLPDQSFLITMLGNLLLMSFAFSATFTATLRAICL